MRTAFLDTPVTSLLIIVTFISSCLGFYHTNFKHKLLLHPYSILHQKQFYRLFSAGFVHNNWMHLIGNTVVTITLGFKFEEQLAVKSGYGNLFVLFLYLLCLLTGNLLSTIVNRKDFTFTSCGSSPAALGIIVGICMLNPRGYLPLPFIIGENRFIIIYFILALLTNMLTKRLKHVDNAAHFGGIFMAIAVTYTLTTYHHPKQFDPVAPIPAPIMAPTPPKTEPAAPSMTIVSKHSAFPPTIVSI